REIGVGLRNGQRAIQNVERLHRMADVDDLRLGGNLQYDPLHGADEMIVESEIGGERDDRDARQSIASSSLKVFRNSNEVSDVARRRVKEQSAFSIQPSALSQFPFRWGRFCPWRSGQSLCGCFQVWLTAECWVWLTAV